MEKLLSYPLFGVWMAAIYTLILLIININNHSVPDWGIGTDFFWDYVPSAHAFLEGKINIDNYRGPGYPVILGIFGFLLGNMVLAGIVIATLSAGFTVFFTFEMLKRLFRPDIAFIATLIMAVNLIFIQHSYSAGTDMLFAALVSATAYFIFKDKELKWSNIAISAVFIAAAYMTRYNALFAVAAIPFCIVIINLYKINLKKRFLAAFLYIAVFFIAIAPWGIYCMKEKDSFFYNENYKNIAYEYYGKETMGWDEFWFGEGVDINSLTEVIFNDPAHFFSHYFSNAFSHFIGDMGFSEDNSPHQRLLGWFIGIFVIIGIILSFFYKPDRHQLSWYLFNLLFYAVLLLVFYGARFSMFLLPFYAVLALQAFTLGKKPFESWTDKFRLAAFVSAAIVLMSLHESYEYNKTNISSGPKELIFIGRWAERNIVTEDGKKGVVAARKPHIAYYLGLNFRNIPRISSNEEFISFLKDREVDYLYYSYIENQFRPELSQLLDPSKAPAILTPVYHVQNPPHVLYRVNRGMLE